MLMHNNTGQESFHQQRFSRFHEILLTGLMKFEYRTRKIFPRSDGGVVEWEYGGNKKLSASTTSNSPAAEKIPFSVPVASYGERRREQLRRHVESYCISMRYLQISRDGRWIFMSTGYFPIRASDGANVILCPLEASRRSIDTSGIWVTSECVISVIRQLPVSFSWLSFHRTSRFEKSRHFTTAASILFRLLLSPLPFQPASSSRRRWYPRLLNFFNNKRAKRRNKQVSQRGKKFVRHSTPGEENWTLYSTKHVARNSRFQLNICSRRTGSSNYFVFHGVPSRNGATAKKTGTDISPPNLSDLFVLLLMKNRVLLYSISGMEISCFLAVRFFSRPSTPDVKRFPAHVCQIPHR